MPHNELFTFVGHLSCVNAKHNHNTLPGLHGPWGLHGLAEPGRAPTIPNRGPMDWGNQRGITFRPQHEENFLVYVSFSLFGFSVFQFSVFVGEPGRDLFGGTRGG